MLCLGNEVLADDAVGYFVAERLCARVDVTRQADVEFAARAGFALIDLLAGRSRVLIVDSICTGGEPGTLHYFPMRAEAPSRHLTASHQLSLPVALDLGARLGYDLPAHIDVLAVEAQDVTTLGGDLTPAVGDRLPELVHLVADWVRGRPLPIAARQPEFVERI